MIFLQLQMISVLLNKLGVKPSTKPTFPIGWH